MSEPFLGQIQMFGFNFAPRGWALCDGQTLPISQNSALFSLLGTIYGGDGRTNFKLPDMRGRVATHFGTGVSLTPRTIGQKFGDETETLSVNQIPSHTHTAKCKADKGNKNTAAGHVWSDDLGVSSATYSDAAPDGDMKAGAIANAGGGQSHNNMQPTLVINFCIAIVGLFPSRN